MWYDSGMSISEINLFGQEIARPGDIIGFSGGSFVNDLINIGTFGVPRWGLSHVAVVSTYKGQPVFYESTTLADEPCLVQKRKVRGVQAHPVADMFKRPGKVWLYPVRRPLTTLNRRRLRHAALAHLGVSYDMLGAIQSRGFILKALRSLFRQEDVTELFCSEFVALVLRLSNVVPGKRNASFESPNSLVRHLVRKDLYLPALRIK